LGGVVDVGAGPGAALDDSDPPQAQTPTPTAMTKPRIEARRMGDVLSARRISTCGAKRARAEERLETRRDARKASQS
jgi:hypothetical protein